MTRSRSPSSSAFARFERPIETGVRGHISRQEERHTLSVYRIYGICIQRYIYTTRAFTLRCIPSFPIGQRSNTREPARGVVHTSQRRLLGPLPRLVFVDDTRPLFSQRVSTRHAPSYQNEVHPSLFFAWHNRFYFVFFHTIAWHQPG